MKVRRWLGGGLLLALGALLFIYFRPHGSTSSLNLGLDGCWEVKLSDDGHSIVCWLDPLDPPAEQHIRVLVRETADAELSVDCSGCETVACSTGIGLSDPDSTVAKPECRELIPGAAPHQQAVFRLTAQDKPLNESKVELVVPPLTPMDELRKRWRATGGKLAALLQFIPEAKSFLDAQPPGELHARAQVLFARAQYEKLFLMAHDDRPLADAEAAAAKAEMQKALQVAQERNWLGSAADLSEELTWFYRDRPGAVANIDALLKDQHWLPLVPRSKVRVYQWLIVAALAQHDLRYVEKYADEALADADALNIEELFRSSVELRTQYIAQLALTGNPVEANEKMAGLQKLAAKATNSCDQAYIWGITGWTQLQLWELGWPSAQDPTPALKEAKKIREQHCPGPGGKALANAEMNLARARSARWRTAPPDSANIKEEVAAVQQAIDKKTLVMGKSALSDGDRIDQLLVEARIHLLQKEPQKALGSLHALREIKQLSQSPIEQWLATVHQAEAQEADSQLAAALATFRKAEAQLVMLQGHVPVYQSHRLMLERYEYSSQRAVELALRLQQPKDAVEIIRQASQRALGLTMTPWWSQDEPLADPRWEQRRNQQADYLNRRSLYESHLTSVTTMTESECRDLVVRKRNWLGAMDALFRDPAPALFVPPQLPANELFITCAKQNTKSVCLGTLNGTPKVVQLPGALDRDAVETQLLPELAEQVQQAAKIRVLAGGALAELKLAEIKFQGYPLGTRKPIRYTLDRPPVAKVPTPRQALLVVKPEVNSIAGLSVDAAYQQLAPALQGLTVIARSATPTPSAPASWQRGTATSPEVLTDLPRSDVFIYFGHINPMPCPMQSQSCSFGGESLLKPDPRLTAMCLGQHTALSTADILVAPKVPQLVVLLGCASAGRSDTPNEMLGLAQALALRGAQVLAFSTAFRSDQAAEVLCALGQEHLDRLDFDMDRFVMDTQRHLYEGQRCNALGKWHTPRDIKLASPDVDWSAIRSYGP